MSVVKPSGRASEKSRRRAREAAILNAALDVFAENGFSAARLDEIAARAGIAKGTIYLYFASKEELFRALIRTGIAKPLDEVRVAAATRDLPLEGLLRGLFARVRRDILETRRKEILRLLIAECGRFPELADIYFSEVIGRGLPLLREWFERAAERGEIRSDEAARFPQLIIAPMIAAFLWSMLFERIQPLDAEAMLDAHVALLMRGLRNEP